MDFITIGVVPIGAVMGAVSVYYVLGWPKLRQELQLGRKKPISAAFGAVGRYVYVPLTILVLILALLWAGSAKLPAQIPGRGDFLAMIRRQHHIDMCNGPLWNKILLFALPLMASSILQLLFNAADVVVVGRYAGQGGPGGGWFQLRFDQSDDQPVRGPVRGHQRGGGRDLGAGGTTTSAAASTPPSPWPSSAASAWPCSASLWSASCWSG